MVEPTERPSRIAQSEAPLPRWATMTRPFASGVIGGELAGDVIVAQPVEAVAPHAFVVEAARQGEGVVDPWVAAVKGGVEAGHLHRLGEGRDGRAHPGEVVGLVQRRQRAERVEPFRSGRG
jgi:hypothetical protein